MLERLTAIKEKQLTHRKIKVQSMASVYTKEEKRICVSV